MNRSFAPLLLAFPGVSLLQPLLQQGTPPQASAPSRAELVARDARVSFARVSAARARAELECELGETSRCAALMALGASGRPEDVMVLEASAKPAADRNPRERRAAVLALGELGDAGIDGLIRLLRGDFAGVEEALVLALVQAGMRPEAELGSSRAHALVQELASGPESRLAQIARELLPMTAGAEAPAALSIFDERLELRWQAAKRYGFVDAARYQDLLLSGLLENDAFLDRLVVAASRRIDGALVRGHLLELLRERPSTELVRTAASFVPGALDELFAAGEWAPEGAEQWSALVAEIERSHNEKLAERLLQAAFASGGDPSSEESEREDLQMRAGIALLRTGFQPDPKRIQAFAEKADRPWKIKFLESAGDLRETWIVPILGRSLERGSDHETAAAATVAMARLGHPTAIEHLEQMLVQPSGPERGALLAALARVAFDRRVIRWIGRGLELPDLTGEEAFSLELAYALGGGLRDHAPLRRFLEDADPSDPRRALVVRALAQRPSPADLERMRVLFPTEDRDLDQELAVALLEARDPAVLGLFRAVLWKGDWNRSLLAGGALLDVLGAGAFVDELASPPMGSQPADLRRVGFALGEFGGLPAVEGLARKRTESDPALQGAVLGALSTRGM